MTNEGFKGNRKSKEEEEQEEQDVQDEFIHPSVSPSDDPSIHPSIHGAIDVYLPLSGPGAHPSPQSVSPNSNVPPFCIKYDTFSFLVNWMYPEFLGMVTYDEDKGG